MIPKAQLEKLKLKAARISRDLVQINSHYVLHRDPRNPTPRKIIRMWRKHKEMSLLMNEKKISRLEAA